MKDRELRKYFSNLVNDLSRKRVLYYTFENMFIEDMVFTSNIEQIFPDSYRRLPKTDTVSSFDLVEIEDKINKLNSKLNTLMELLVVKEIHENSPFNGLQKGNKKVPFKE